VRGPEVFLFDEPLSNLDAALRVQTRIEIARLHESLGTTMIYVTHDQVEAMTLADKIVVLRDGKIEQIGSPIELYKNPNNMFVAQFIGSPKMNFFELKDLTDNGRSLIRSGADTLGIRPEHLKISTADAAVVEGIPNLIEHLGEYAIVHCETLTGNQFIIKTTELDQISKGTLSGFCVEANDTYSFDSASQQIKINL
jgi:ABC-type sugar transport system ATPase subunit